MKEDVVAANLANLRQSINELKECVKTECNCFKPTEQHIKVDLDEKTIYNGVAKSFCTCWNDALVSSEETCLETTTGYITIFTMVPQNSLNCFKQKI